MRRTELVWRMLIIATLGRLRVATRMDNSCQGATSICFMARATDQV